MSKSMKLIRFCVLAAAVLASLGSASSKPTYEFTRNGPSRGARPAKCKMPVFATAPRRPFEELAIFDIPDQDIGLPSAENPQDSSHHGPKSVRDLLWVIQPEACAMGADGLLAEVNGMGFYVRAVAIAWTETEAEEGDDEGEDEDDIEDEAQVRKKAPAKEAPDEPEAPAAAAPAPTTP